jgi:putative methyltransferase (TIGR04325 family)
VYANYEEALPHCGADTYEGESIAEVVFAKTANLTATLSDPRRVIGDSGLVNQVFAILIAREYQGAKSIVNVLDFGGACGAHYFGARVLLRDCGLRWCLVDTEPMVTRGVKLATAELQFRRTISEAEKWLGRVSVVHSSAALQYVSDPLKIVRELISLEPNVILLSRLGLAEGGPFTMIQTSRLSDNGPGPLPRGMKDRQVKYPVTFVNRKVFEDTLLGAYTIAAQYWDTAGDYHTTCEDIKGSCYLLLKRRQP